MRYAIVGGDMRFVHLACMLRESGREARGFLQEKVGGEHVSMEEIGKCDAIISNWPMRWPNSEQKIEEKEILRQIAPGSVMLFCGPKFPSERRWDLQYVNLWQDEQLLQENAFLTAEAAIEAAQKRMRSSYIYENFAVIGYGRIGKFLTDILLKQGARVTVFSRSAEKRMLAEKSGAENADLAEIKDAIRNQHVIFSTPPSSVLDREVLQCVKKDALLMDLASPPYGFDLEVALELGLQAFREPGLPGRYCPLSAARAIFNAVLRWEEEENG